MDFVLQNFFWASLAVASGAAYLWFTFKGEQNAISQQDAVTLMNRESAVVIDVRDATEFSAGHLPAARHMSLENLEMGASDLDKFKNRPCIVYCERGTRAGKAAKILAAKGFERVFALEGGMEAWHEGGMPVER